MGKSKLTLSAIIALFFLLGCKEAAGKTSVPIATDTEKRDPAPKDTVPTDSVAPKTGEAGALKLTEENAIDFFFDYQKNLTVNTARITTDMGSFTVRLYDNVPYHKANFIYLARKGYFDNTQFHRIVKDFIIQGGNSDDSETSRKRNEIGRYLLPPDTRKGHKHDRGTLSMPSSEIGNPHKLASPYEFFIVVTKPGSYHLDGGFTPFGKVIEGMDVVDKINAVPVGKGDWPHQNVYIRKVEVLE